MTDIITIDKIDTETLMIPIVGTSPLIVHRFSEKAKRQILEAQQGKKSVKQVRDPEAEYQAAFYRLTREDGSERFGFPVTAFKSATIGAARFYGKSVRMTELRQFLFFTGLLSLSDPQQLVEIVGEPRMREDIVRLSGASRAPEPRYRPEFWPWSASLEVTYVKTSLSRDSVLSLVDAGGFGVGVGEWRPEKRGEFGTYKIDVDKGVEIVG
jgi:hypothetical protein